MFATFIQASKVKRAYELNGIIYRLKSIPFIGKHISSSEYTDGPIRNIGKLLLWINTIIGFCIGEIIYLLCLMIAVLSLVKAVGYSFESVFITLFTCLALIGIPVNNYLLDPTVDKFYAINLLRMDARKYVLSDLIYRIIRKITGYALMFTGICLLLDLNPLVAVSGTVLTILGKFLGSYIKLEFARRDKISSYSQGLVFYILIMSGICALLICFGWPITSPVLYVITGIVAVTGALAAYKLWCFGDYQVVCKSIITTETTMVLDKREVAADIHKKSAANQLSKDTDSLTFKSSKSGYEMFNELFFRRHSKILLKRTGIISVALLVGLIIIILYNYIMQHYFGRSKFDDPVILFYTMPLALYFINTGDGVTNAMFYNCDSAMLTYNFYRKPSALLGLFRQRLKLLIKLNIVPAFLLSCCLSSLCLLSSMSSVAVNCLASLILCLALSVFFSVHRLVAYYLLQPYTEGLDKPRFGYGLVNSLTYLASYTIFMAKDKISLSPVNFALCAVAFSIIYVLIALALVYRFAPSRFVLHK